MTDPDDNAAAKLAWLLEVLRDREDVIDGSDGSERPNEAMSILADYAERWGER